MFYISSKYVLNLIDITFWYNNNTENWNVPSHIQSAIERNGHSTALPVQYGLSDHPPETVRHKIR